MKKSNLAKRGPQDAQQPPSQPDKTGWIRKFCGKGIFREIWKNRFVVLKGDQLYISEKEVKDEKRVQEVVDLSDYERSEELRRSKSRSKRNHSKFTLLRSRQPGNPQVPNLVFLAVSPEEKESWISVLNVAITRAKNHALDQSFSPSLSVSPPLQVTVERESPLSHPTRDRPKIPHARRLPTRGHLLAVASTSDGMLTLDFLPQEDRAAPGPRGPTEASDGDMGDPSLSPWLRPPSARKRAKSGSLPRRSEGSQDWLRPEAAQCRTPQPGKRPPAVPERSRCVSMEILTRRADGPPHDRVRRKLPERSPEPRGGGGVGEGEAGAGSQGQGQAEQLLKEAVTVWGEAQEVLQEVKELQGLFRKLDLGPSPLSSSPPQHMIDS